MPLHAVLITLLTVFLLGIAMSVVSRARGLHRVAAPSVTGPPAFERAFRAHQNLLEQTLMFLPTLWVASLVGNPAWAAWAGYAWLFGRAWYQVAYVREGGKRGTPFTLAILAWLALWLIALAGVWPALASALAR
jgi:glutathione S-transferase